MSTPYLSKPAKAFIRSELVKSRAELDNQSLKDLDYQIRINSAYSLFKSNPNIIAITLLDKRRIYLNPIYLSNNLALIKETIYHEIAHALLSYLDPTYIYSTKAHSNQWLKIAKRLGCKHKAKIPIEDYIKNDPIN